ncbi:MAG: HDOD domain-containing protein [Deltaproteobacteria bacterium]|nr:MAG: HDOD domain-containing protein [Deltaproteobacteria bacterium]
MDANFLKKHCRTHILCPSTPCGCSKLIQLTSNANVNIKEVGQVISLDIGIASKLLQIVNSPFYGLRQKLIQYPKRSRLLGLKRYAL